MILALFCTMQVQRLVGLVVQLYHVSGLQIRRINWPLAVWCAPSLIPHNVGAGLEFAKRRAGSAWNRVAAMSSRSLRAGACRGCAAGRCCEAREVRRGEWENRLTVGCGRFWRPCWVATWTAQIGRSR